MVTASGQAASLAGRVVAVTGASGGIGAAVARELSAAGALLVLGAGPGERRALPELPVDRSVETETDVTSEESLSAFASLALDRFGHLDGLVTAAGVMEQASLADLDLATWDRTIGINLTGTFLAVRAVAPHLRPGSAIVTLASQLAYSGALDVVAYTASKAGVIGLTRALAHELGPGVRVNAVAPGPVETPMTGRHATPEWVARKTSRMIMGRFARPEEVSGTVRFLLSDEASFFTGQTLSPNGGGVMP